MQATVSPTKHTIVVGVLTALLLTVGCTEAGPSDAEISASRDAQDKTQKTADEAEAVQEAEQAIRDYMHVGSQCFTDPSNTDPSCFDRISVDQELAEDRAMLEYAQENNTRQVGEPTYVETTRVVKVDLPVGSNKEVQLAGCRSIEGYDVLNADGTSAIPADQPRREQFVFVVRKHGGDWRLAEVLEDPEGNEC